MFVRVHTASFKQSIKELLRGLPKAYVNFYVDSTGRLRLQTSAGVVVEYWVPADGEWDTGFDITVQVDRILELLNGKQEFVDIFVSGNILTITQGGFTFSAGRQPELRVDVDAWEIPAEQRFPLARFTDVVEGTKCLDDVAKTLGKDKGALTFLDGLCYMAYSNAIYVGECGMPDMRLGADVARKVVRLAEGLADVKYNYSQESGIMRIVTGKSATVYVTALKPDKRMVAEYRELRGKVRQFATVNMQKYYGMLQVIARAIKKSLVELTVSGQGIQVCVSNASTNFTVGDVGPDAITIKISIAQLNAIAQIFGACAEVEVWKGGNVLCLAEKRCKKELLIGGMLY